MSNFRELAEISAIFGSWKKMKEKCQLKFAVTVVLV